ncbi:hypothetical protein FJTKL_15225 [Diaporthe vaccinii]|uniref:Linalool dehydratase/isomerase domain-containing protein n=1 Tax=Diaporthe vaccinii TaxID=105482 RepID=A0ABR4E5T8_9PEZI
MEYWKWESIFGELNFSDWNPIKKDNIMVTGYLASAMAASCPCAPSSLAQQFRISAESFQTASSQCCSQPIFRT